MKPLYLKPLYLVGILAVLILFAGAASASTYEIVDYDPDDIDHNVNIRLDVTIRNTGSDDAHDVRVSISSSDTEIVVTGGRKTISEIEDGEDVEVTFSLDIGEPEEGDHEMTITIRDRDDTVFKSIYLDADDDGDSDDDDDDDDVEDRRSCEKDFKILGANLVNEEDKELNPTDKAEYAIYLKSRSKYKLDDIVATLKEDEPRIRADGKWFYYDFLKRGDSKPGYFVIETDNAKPGQYELTLEIEYEKEDRDCELDLDVNFTVKGDYGVAIDMKPDSSDLEGGKAVEFTLDIRNTGSREDSYSISFFEGVRDWVQEYPEEVVVEEGEKESVPITLYIPDVTGTYQLGIKAISNTLSSTSDTDVSYFTITEVEKPIHKIYLDYPKETFDVSPGKTKTVGVTVENLGNVVEDIRVSVDGPYWAFVAPSEFTLDPEGKREVSLYFAPDVNEEMGTLDITVKAFAKKSTAEAEARLGIFVTGGVPEEPAGSGITGAVTGAGEKPSDSAVTSISMPDLPAGLSSYLLPIMGILLIAVIFSYKRSEKEESVL